VPTWGWILIGVGVGAAVVGVIWYLIHRNRPRVDRSGLIDSERTRLVEEKNAETKARAIAEKQVKELEAELRAIAERKKKRLEELDEQTAKKFRDLTDDPDALLARVDEILRR